MSTKCLNITMELLFITVICILFCNDHLVKASSSLQNDQVLQPLHEKDSKLKHPLHLELPRKLRLFEEQTVKGYDGDHHAASQSYNKQKEDASGNAMLDSSRTGTMQRELVKDRADTSQLFTMDYSDVRRRRPIHNMSVKQRP